MDKRLHKPIAALALSSLAGCALLASRAVLLGSLRHGFLVWNLFLAWLPLLFALMLECRQRRESSRSWITPTLAVAWLVFFPNSSYILTDLVHLAPRSVPHFWPDLVLVLIFGLTGLILGFLSLYLMQRLVARRLGWIIGWLFVCSAAILNGFGVYAGRFMRWNSWDVLLNPMSLALQGLEWVVHMPRHPRLLVFPLLFSILMFLAYVMLYALTQLAQTESALRESTAVDG